MHDENIVENNARPVTLITGGSEGIGRALANLFAARGDLVYLVARSENRLRIAADELEKDWNVPVQIAAIDLMQAGSANRLMDGLEQQGFYVENLVNSAAIAFMGRFDDSDFNTIKALVQLNILTSTEITHRCLVEMKKRDSGGVLNIASLGGLLPMPNLALYSASKSYLISLTRALAEEIRDTNINISVLVPGPVDTSFIQHGGTRFQMLTPMLTPDSVARVGFEGFMAGQTVITPGLMGAFYRLGIKVIPHKFLLRLLSPILKRMYSK